MIRFFTTIIQSITDPSFYGELRSRTLWQTIRFYLLFLLLITVIFTAELFLRILPALRSGVEELQQNYPQELVITWNKPDLSLNQPSVTVPFPSKFKQVLNLPTEQLAVIQQSEELPQVDSMFVLTPSSLYTLNDGSVINKYPLSEVITVDSFTVSQASLPQVIADLQPLINILLFVLAAVMPLGYFLGLLVTRGYLFLLEAGLGYLLLKLFGTKISFKEFSKIALHIFVPAELIAQSIIWSGVDVPFSMFSLTYWLYLVVIWLNLTKKRALS